MVVGKQPRIPKTGGTLKVNATAARPKLHPGDDDPSLTAHAGLALTGELVARIGLIEGIDARLGHLKSRRRGLSLGEFVVSMAESVLAGGSYLCDIERLRADEAGASLRAVANPPAPSTAGQLFGRFALPDCWKLERASAEAANRLDEALGLTPGVITLDADFDRPLVLGAKFGILPGPDLRILRSLAHLRFEEQLFSEPP